MADSSSSTSAFVSSLIFNGRIAAIFTLAFLTLRPRNRRVYEPRTLDDIKTIKDEERTERVPSGYFRWVPFLLSRPHSFLIQHASLDGYFYLRYIALGAGFSLLGIILMYPIILPVNATNGRNYQGFELLSFANVTNKNRFFAHVFLSWIFYGAVVFTIYRELYYYIMVRHALQTTPMYDSLVSSRTLVITELHSEMVDEEAMLNVFPRADRAVFAHDEVELQKLVAERAKSAQKLEGALNKCLNKCVKMKRKADEKVGVPEVDGDRLEDYIPEKKRPKRRLGKWKIPFLGEKVDVIEYDSKRIGELNEDIHDLQSHWEETKTLPVCFVQFPSQLEAQRAYQTIKSRMKGMYGRAIIGYSGENISWGNMELTKPMRRSKRVGANAFLTAMIIFWAIPVALVGCISNISFLTSKVHWLRFIDKCPKPLLGLITGILPAVALGILMSLVPPIIMFAGRKSGCMTVQETDLYCQTWYFAFQVVQVFLVTTCTSSASATVDAIINDPASAMTLLANNLPKASNFYISYFLLQGLSVSSGTLLQVVTLLLSKVIGKILDSTPRKKWNRYCTLAKPTMGVAYPIMELLVSIALCYSVIAPLILIFSLVGLSLMYLAYVYTLNYVQGFTFDSKGRNYPHALFQVFCGLYLSQVCLIGLFIMAKTWGPLVLEIVALVATAGAHIWFKRRFYPLVNSVPLSAIRYVYGEEFARYPDDQGFYEIKNAIDQLEQNDLNGGENHADSFKYQLHDHRIGKSSSGSDKREEHAISKDSEKGDREMEDFESAFMDTPDQDRLFVVEREGAQTLGSNESLMTRKTDVFGDNKQIVSPKNSFAGGPTREWGPERPKSWRERVMLYFQPSKYYTFEEVRSRLPTVFESTVEYEDSELGCAYTDPSVVDKDPIIWVCEDPMGVSKQQIELAREAGADVRDENTAYDEKGRAQYTGDPPDFEI
ncbi:hypothetical protein ZYGR_0AG02460 [Zygosaccharomyces rouxii]|uniref:Phosphate metabolism protein 7 n=1 Tax=Zygosaccharomyces rouxii TaxID=4956 RepID=A0A1Q3A982_ZYGRO|nr:hypothetical protein ZYGR_0AG02460 [Zygosaccharomyces rouxii]